MLGNWQEQKSLESENRTPEKLFSIATVDAVFSDGITLTFPGEAPGLKRYKYNLDVSFSAGDRVVVAYISGTHVVVCRI